MNAIEVHNLSKKYVINHQTKKKPQTLRELLTLSWKRKKQVCEVAESEQAQETFWALKDVSFSVGEGERIAIIGGNGAGKSTLLKILSRITEPTHGKVAIRGKVSSLLEVGTGFHPELTGRENIYLNGAILGMKKSEITSKFDQIVAFSGVEKFIDTPVKHYSSGMYVRLAFSVSAWLDPDILIVDEVLSVGDQAFQKRCADRIKDMTSDGRTVILVSHSMRAVKSMCEKALYLKKGEVVSFATVDDVTTDYLRTMQEGTGSDEVWHRPKFELPDTLLVTHVDIADYADCIGGHVTDAHNQVTANLNINEPFSLTLNYRLRKEVPHRVVPNFHFYDEDGSRVFISFPENTSQTTPGLYQATCHIDPFQFNVGRFSVTMALSSYELDAPLHFAVDNALRFDIHEPQQADARRHGWEGGLPGVTRPRLNWTFQAHSC